jgi:hypothetical protein
MLNKGRPSESLLTYEGFWKYFLEVFDSVTVIGRLFSNEDYATEPVTGPGVNFLALPGFIGLNGYLKNCLRINKILKYSYSKESAYLLHLPGLVATLIWFNLRKNGHPFGVNVTGDPYDSFSPGAYNDPLRPMIRVLSAKLLRLQCKDAAVASYVTHRIL